MRETDAERVRRLAHPKKLTSAEYYNNKAKAEEKRDGDSSSKEGGAQGGEQEAPVDRGDHADGNGNGKG